VFYLSYHSRSYLLYFSFHGPAPTYIYTISLHDALPIYSDSSNTDIQTFIRTIDDSTSEVKGHFKVSEKNVPENFVLYSIDTLTEKTGYFTVECSYLNGSVTTLSDNEDLVITFARTGDQGETGYTGSKGETGEVGVTGAKGDQGDIGYTGSKGDTGAVGFTGSKGDQGLIGYTGSKGDLGYTGDTGSQGVIGYTGSQDKIGYTGSEGNSGKAIAFALVLG